MPSRTRVSAVVILLGFVRVQACLAVDDSQTTLGNRGIRYTVPESGYHILRRGDVRAVIVDNRAVDDGTLTGHRAGYSGVASLTHAQREENLFVPSYAGLNYEHIHDGTRQDRNILFEPRRAPMELRVINADTVELYQAPTPNWKLESVLRYAMLSDGTIEMTLECIPRAKTFRTAYVGLFWASYIHSPESLDIHFQGADRTAPGSIGWIRGVTPAHGSLSTHVFAEDQRVLQHDSDFPLTLAFNNSKHVYSEPWYYGISHGMAFIQMFRPQDQIRLTQSPSGGGQGNPAWDFQWFVPEYKVGTLYRMVMRAQYVPFESPQQIQRVSRSHRNALGQPVSRQEAEQSVRRLDESGVQFRRNGTGNVSGVSFTRRNVTCANIERLAALPELQAIRLYETNATDETVRQLRPLTNLQSLDLGFCPRLTDAAVADIAEHRDLKFLNLGFARQLSVSGFTRLASLKKLSVLNLSVTSLDDAGLAGLSVLRNLTSLDIDNTRVTDAGVRHLLKLTRLRALRLVGLPLSDNGVLQLASLTSLRHVNLRDVPVSAEAIHEFRRKRPQCVIKY